MAGPKGGSIPPARIGACQTALEGSPEHLQFSSGHSLEL
jgi:hypothetical protein